MGNGWENDSANELRQQDDRLWILLDKGERPSSTAARGRSAAGRADPWPAAEPPGGERTRRTIVVRDGEKLLISVSVGRGSALAAPLRIDELPCAGARLVVRLASEITPCPRCVDEGLMEACDERGGAGPDGILAAVRAGLERCAVRQQLHPGHGSEASGSEPPPPSRPSAALRLAPPNAPHVPAGGPLPDGRDMDLILII